ncbi:MAG: AMP-binding protein, partial [Gaiellales bacterium]
MSATAWPTLEKSVAAMPVEPNLPDYDAARRGGGFWQAARRELEGLPGGTGLNIAHEAVDRQAAGARAGHLALRCIGKDGAVRDHTYADLRRLTSRFANVLQSLGVGRGDRVYALAGRIPELYVAALGTLKNRSVFCPLFSAFGPEPIRSRMQIGDARVLVTTEQLYRRKVQVIRDALPSLQH